MALFHSGSRQGHVDYGFYNPTFSPAQPESVFTNALQDFPALIHYGDSWSGNTVFYSTESLGGGLGYFPVQVTYTSTDTVDAFGLVTLPNLGFLSCLRVHELDEYDIAFDLGDETGYQDAGTQYVAHVLLAGPRARHGRADQFRAELHGAARQSGRSSVSISQERISGIGRLKSLCITAP